MLESLVTDVYWPSDGAWVRRLKRLLPDGVERKLSRRSTVALPGSGVKACLLSGSLALACSHSAVPFRLQRSSMRHCDRQLGKRAAQIANASGSALLSYSYYGYSAFTYFRRELPRILFQLHPHPLSARTILEGERSVHPDSAPSLNREWELALPETDFQALVQESRMADHWICASSFTKQTLVENGAAAERIHVVPYGVDLERFQPKHVERPRNAPLRVLFVGTVCERKGIRYLFDAIDSLTAGSVDLTICGRSAGPVSGRASTRARLRRFVSSEELVHEYQSADVFVFPSLLEGFGHVLLEAMACGLPVISTTRTAAPDLVRQGQEGFVIPPGNARELARCLEFFISNPENTRTMGRAARVRAEEFTWTKFRRGIVEAVTTICNPV